MKDKLAKFIFCISLVFGDYPMVASITEFQKKKKLLIPTTLCVKFISWAKLLK